MPQSIAQTTVGLRLDKATQQRLKTLGQARDRSAHYLMKEAVDRYLTTEETIETERQLTKSRWEQYELTGQSVPHEDVVAWAAQLDDTEKTT